MRLEPVAGDDPRAILRALKSALHGAGPALGLGMVDDSARDVPAGTAVVVTTSGSTGVPKSVMISRSALTAGAIATADRIGDGAWLLALPATYVAGLQVLVRAVVAGREPALLSGVFSPQAFTAAALSMSSSRGGERVPTYTSLVPAQLNRLLDAAEDDATVLTALRSFETIMIGGQALSPLTRKRAESAGIRIVRTYGSTETSGGCVYDGVPLRGVGLRISAGEVQISGPTLAEGYLGEQERTDASFLRDHDGTRWYRTGDAGVIEDGTLRVHGRIDNVIVSGGINISLDRVERIVRSTPGLHNAVVVGVDDERWGEASVIVAERGEALRETEARVPPRERGMAREDGPREDALLSAARSAVAEVIGAHARPARLVLVDHLPTLPSGKPDRATIGREVSRPH